jgi:hypothetical protein
VKSIAAKIDVRQEYLLSASKSQECATDVDAHFSRTDGNNESCAGKEVTFMTSNPPPPSSFADTARGDDTTPRGMMTQ